MFNHPIRITKHIINRASDVIERSIMTCA